MVVQRQVFAQLGGETLGVFQVLHAYGAAGDLVFIGRTDAATGGANFRSAGFFLGGFTGHI